MITKFSTATSLTQLASNKRAVVNYIEQVSFAQLVVHFANKNFKFQARDDVVRDRKSRIFTNQHFY